MDPQAGKIYFHGIWRMDWGLGNPNFTAALIVTLMVAIWWLAYIKRWGFWVALILFTGLGICLIHTFSRGGIVALATGLIPFLWTTPHPWPWRKIVGVVAAVWVVVGVSIYIQADSRYMQGIAREDLSITHRLEIWKAAPRMMVSAPSGWGVHQASNAYQEWFQPTDRPELYLNLINSHLTWLVEIGWMSRFLYIFGWLAVLVLCWPGKSSRWFAIPLGIWLAFGVAGIFSHVAQSPWLWIVPGCSLVPVLVARIRQRHWPTLPALLSVSGASAASLMCLYLIGSMNPELRISGSADGVVVGSGKPKVWVVLNRPVMGEAYGKTLRRYLQSSGVKTPIGLVAKMQDLPRTEDITVVVCGNVDGADLTELKQYKKLILLNPSFLPQEIDFNKSKSITVYFGEFSESPALEAWRDLGVIQNLVGKGDFLANWPELVLGSALHP